MANYGKKQRRKDALRAFEGTEIELHSRNNNLNDTYSNNENDRFNALNKQIKASRNLNTSKRADDSPETQQSGRTDSPEQVQNKADESQKKADWKMAPQVSSEELSQKAKDNNLNEKEIKGEVNKSKHLSKKEKADLKKAAKKVSKKPTDLYTRIKKSIKRNKYIYWILSPIGGSMSCCGCIVFLLILIFAALVYEFYNLL